MLIFEIGKTILCPRLLGYGLVTFPLDKLINLTIFVYASLLYKLSCKPRYFVCF
jgi:hypothetical protein